MSKKYVIPILLAATVLSVAGATLSSHWTFSVASAVLVAAGMLVLLMQNDGGRAAQESQQRCAELEASLESAGAELAACRERLESVQQADPACRDVGELQEAMAMVAEAVPIIASLGDTAIEKSQKGSTKITDDIYGIAKESQGLGESIAEFLTGLSYGSDSLTDQIDELLLDNRRLTSVVESFETTKQKLDVSLESILESVAATTDLITKVTDIAEQTSILAINAAIYAAKAGEYGQGFSVIATEIQKLAATSKTVADTIGSNTVTIENQVTEFSRSQETLMQESRVNLEQTVSSIEATVNGLKPKVQAMSQSTEQASSVSRVVTERLNEISMAMQEQDAIQQIIGHMVDVLQMSVSETPDVHWGDGLEPQAAAEIREKIREMAASCFSMKDEYEAIEHDGYVVVEKQAAVVLDDGSELDGDVTLF
jgi:methyl-accepting chemotaxis protein